MKSILALNLLPLALIVSFAFNVATAYDTCDQIIGKIKENYSKSKLSTLVSLSANASAAMNPSDNATVSPAQLGGILDGNFIVLLDQYNTSCKKVIDYYRTNLKNNYFRSENELVLSLQKDLTKAWSLLTQQEDSFELMFLELGIDTDDVSNDDVSGSLTKRALPGFSGFMTGLKGLPNKMTTKITNTFSKFKQFDPKLFKAEITAKLKDIGKYDKMAVLQTDGKTIFKSFKPIVKPEKLVNEKMQIVSKFEKGVISKSEPTLVLKDTNGKTFRSYQKYSDDKGDFIQLVDAKGKFQLYKMKDGNGFPTPAEYRKAVQNPELTELQPRELLSINGQKGGDDVVVTDGKKIFQYDDGTIMTEIYKGGVLQKTKHQYNREFVDPDGVVKMSVKPENSVKVTMKDGTTYIYGSVDQIPDATKLLTPKLSEEVSSKLGGLNLVKTIKPGPLRQIRNTQVWRNMMRSLRNKWVLLGLGVVATTIVIVILNEVLKKKEGGDFVDFVYDPTSKQDPSAAFQFD